MTGYLEEFQQTPLSLAARKAQEEVRILRAPAMVVLHLLEETLTEVKGGRLHKPSVPTSLPTIEERNTQCRVGRIESGVLKTLDI
jgi:hypothetical protein